MGIESYETLQNTDLKAVLYFGVYHIIGIVLSKATFRSNKKVCT